jgi:hypothetical protein
VLAPEGHSQDPQAAFALGSERPGALLALWADPPEPPAVLARGGDPQNPPAVLARGADPQEPRAVLGRPRSPLWQPPHGGRERLAPRRVITEHVE